MKNNAHFIYAAIFAAIFLCLLGVKNGIFIKHPQTSPPSEVELSEKNTWMNIYRNNRKIGYSHRVLRPENDGYTIIDQTFMRINTMGMIEDVYFETNGKLNTDFTISMFNFELKSSTFKLVIYGSVEGETLQLNINGEKNEIKLEQPPYLSTGFIDKVLEKQLSAGGKETMYIFDPSTMSQKPVHILYIGDEKIRIKNNRIDASKFEVDYMGLKQNIWVDRNKEVVREDGFMGIHIEKTSRDDALSDLQDTPSEDITYSVSIPSNVSIENKTDLSFIKVKIDGLTNTKWIHGGRQAFENNLLTIKKEQIPDKETKISKESAAFLSPAPFIESDHPEITGLVNILISENDSPPEKTTKIMAWINTHIEKRPVISMPDALETLRNKMGDCNEHAVLFSAMMRAAGIPARIESGLVYLNGRFYYHAWNSLYINGAWITADASMNQLPADVTHIRLITGSLENQVDLISVIGKLKLTVKEKSYD